MNRVYLHIKNQLREFNHFFNNKRIWTFFLLFTFLLYIYISPVINFSILVKYKVSPWGIVFLFTAVYFDLFFLLGAVYIYSQVPFLEKWQMYQQIRHGKLAWGAVQVGKIVLSSFAYVVVTILLGIAILFKNIKFELGWGKVWYTLALTNAGEQYNTEFAVPYEVINNHKNPIAVIGMAVLVISLVTMFIGLLMFLLSIYISRLFGILVASIFSMLVIVNEELATPIQSIMIQIIPTEWIKIHKIGTDYLGVLSLEWNQVIIRLLFYNILLIALILFRIKKMEFNWYLEE